MNWNYIRLEEIADFRNGVNFTSDSFGTGIKVINVADFKDKMYPDYEELGELDSEANWSKECFLKENDIVFVRSNGNKNLIGRSIFIKNLPVDKQVTYSAFSIRLRFKKLENICPEFYLYLFKSPLFRGVLSQYGNGTNISNLNQDILNNMPIPTPPLPIQQIIAFILSAYDELIENNKQRIKLLEEMAEEIYKEWFVRLRFPNYENTEFVDGLPLGWEDGTIGSLYNIKSGFAFKSEDFGDVGFPIIKIRNIDNLEVDTVNCDRYCGEMNDRIKKFEIDNGDLLVAMTGATIGKVALFHKQNEAYYVNQRVGKFFKKSNIISNQAFIYQFSKTDDFKSSINNFALGAAQPNISGEQIENIKLLIPSSDLLQNFSEIVGTMIDEIFILSQKNQLLQQTRDLLLPRLISGKLSVAGLLEDKVYKIGENEERLSMAAEDVV